jgi:hypothetical protein
MTDSTSGKTMIGSTFWEKTLLAAAHSGKNHDWQHILGKKHDWQHILEMIDSTLWEKHDW